MPTTDHDRLRALFERTRYTTPYGTMHVGQELPVGILHWMDDRKATTLAVLGAENPQGSASSSESNQEQHNALVAMLEGKGLPVIDAVGELDDWSERHVVVLSCTKDVALGIGNTFEQAAILWCERDGVVQVEWCQAPYQ